MSCPTRKRRSRKIAVEQSLSSEEEKPSSPSSDQYYEFWMLDRWMYRWFNTKNPHKMKIEHPSIQSW
ncbi:hypothetical protein PHYBLDRAFT_140595 [Phycomyces blakesleeanus NRRL 1555(-)]|uniref:Uncharacterized protein n=1 Tax=Phycomyces blakesleeanus (strain ATCC 8743b / DSM 1359 / FGSC 10004 / NBRC 33097 / NRRL 1555) TaxID=763407 RepID=A0A163B6C3_PHYB8|nr:hypothetical protein PHYBLDRAFT_140595 [Phycomyces blakesleeanus NRRL 1555(-)]OAD78521.1 hypothetical protein PHYBLDRAFT_140595 [Phycomyces blakesleeanus NRRL 1555(-)]|eukprot:XP_018296561.1 hypothetical protein PHYBLDRAFT_140595 [Phycomyces blakesleeanus NRRL 1555(-)]